MKANEIAALGKVFGAEISGTLPFQSKAKIFKELVSSGHLDEMTIRAGIVTIEGYELSHQGRMAYCQCC